jgi:hypothetical protein
MLIPRLTMSNPGVRVSELIHRQTPLVKTQ